ncbi:MAG: hypothetical protein JW973_13065 [Bacteroidales bacterium]|nr:hypothetical protein [Bacteroidales bacterium]
MNYSETIKQFAYCIKAFFGYQFTVLFLSLMIGYNQAFSQDAEPYDTIRYWLENYQYQQALDAINSRLESKGDSTLYVYKGLALKGTLKYSEAIESFQRALKNDSNSLQAMIELSNTYKLLGDFHKALIFLVAANKKNPSPALLTEIAAVLYSMDAYEDALIINSQLVKEDSLNPFLLKNVAKCYDNLEKSDSAIVFFEKAIARNPSDYLSVIRLGNLYIKRRNYEKGIELTELYRSTDSSNAKVNRLNAYCYLLNKDYKTARENFLHCVKNYDTTDFVYKYLGTSYFKLEKYDTAKIYLEKAYIKDSADAQTCYFLGMACSGSYYKELGIHYINKAITLMNPDPEYMSGVYQNLAEACNGFYKYQEGLDALFKAYELNRNDTLLLYKIALQYEWLKDKDLALEYYSDFMLTRPSGGESTLKIHPGYVEMSYYDVVEKRISELKKEIAAENAGKK